MLPEDERVQMLDAIQKLSKETRRTANARRARTTLTRPENTPTATITSSKTVKGIKKKSENKLPQIYRPTEDFNPCTLEADKQAGVIAQQQRDNIAEREKQLDKLKQEETLLGTCRAVRSQVGSSRHSSSGFNGSLFLDPTPSLSLARETALNPRFGAFGGSYEGIHNVALLQLTEDKQLMFSKPVQALPRAERIVARSRDIVTKL